MKNIAIYPGTFDPITFGHIDVIRKSLNIIDNIVIAVSNSRSNKYLFNAKERVEIIKGAASVIYGSSALNGVINIKTISHSEKPKTTLSLTSGFFNEADRKSLNYNNKPEWMSNPSGSLRNRSAITFIGSGIGWPLAATFRHQSKL